jgi:hypothetical protein
MSVGYGSVRRKEDARFIRGQGHYVDDVQLPRMLHGAVLRSPVAHARIVSIDTSAALQHPKVHAVITGADLEASGMDWMPTMSADRQAVLATDKVGIQAIPRASRSRPVSTACTFGCCSAAVASTAAIRAWAKGLRRIAPCSIPGSRRSST